MQRVFAILLMLAALPAAPQSPPREGAEVRAHLEAAGAKRPSTPAVLWLEPVNGTPALSFPSRGHYTLLQKNRMFHPHLQVVPVGAVVEFPNADPFFHNVFSLFDGKRFDLGLYEAGSSKSVTFSREGVSYIFCNIHPEMSAVIVSLGTPLYAVADRSGAFVIPSVPPGEYRVHLWTEGARRGELDRDEPLLHVAARAVDLGTVAVSRDSSGAAEHTNKYGLPYTKQQQPAY